MIGSLTLDQLRVLVAVDEAGSFSAAGRQLRRVQSAISHTIQTLEEVQGVQLFDRSGRTPRLTDAGRILTARARHVLSQADGFELTARAITAGMEPELSIAVDCFAPSQLVIQVLAGLRQQYPALAVTLFTEGLGAAERRVRDGSAMLGLCGVLPGGAAGLQAHAVTTVTMVPVAAPSHPLARVAGPLSRDALAEHVQLILTDPVQRAGPSLGVLSQQVWRFVDIASRLDFLLAGFGWGSMPLHLVQAPLAVGTLVRLTLQDPDPLPEGLGIYAVHERQRPLGPAARWVLAALQQAGAAR